MHPLTERQKLKPHVHKFVVFSMEKAPYLLVKQNENIYVSLLLCCLHNAVNPTCIFSSIHSKNVYLSSMFFFLLFFGEKGKSECIQRIHWRNTYKAHEFILSVIGSCKERSQYTFRKDKVVSIPFLKYSIPSFRTKFKYRMHHQAMSTSYARTAHLHFNIIIFSMHRVCIRLFVCLWSLEFLYLTYSTFFTASKYVWVKKLLFHRDINFLCNIKESYWIHLMFKCAHPFDNFSPAMLLLLVFLQVKKIWLNVSFNPFSNRKEKLFNKLDDCAYIFPLTFFFSLYLFMNIGILFI